MHQFLATSSTRNAVPFQTETEMSKTPIRDPNAMMGSSIPRSFGASDDREAVRLGVCLGMNAKEINDRM